MAIEYEDDNGIEVISYIGLGRSDVRVIALFVFKIKTNNITTDKSISSSTTITEEFFFCTRKKYNHEYLWEERSLSNNLRYIFKTLNIQLEK